MKKTKRSINKPDKRQKNIQKGRKNSSREGIERSRRIVEKQREGFSYQEIKSAKEQHSKQPYYLKDKEGHLIGDKEEKLNMENFEELLNNPEGTYKERSRRLYREPKRNKSIN